jgi:LuxR family maltose regulon positive regulatory protein
MASNLSQREIAGMLYISFNTVKTHSKSIFRKLGVATRAEAVARARELHVIHSPRPLKESDRHDHPG